MGGQVISSTNVTEASRFPNRLDTLYFRTRSNNEGDSVELSDLTILDDNGSVSYGGSVGSSDGDTVNYLLISDIEGDFTLTGNANLSWIGSPPNNSRLAFQVKGGATIPEPLTILGSATALPEFLTKSAIAKHRSLTGSGFEQSDRRFPQPTVCCQILS